MEQSQFKSLSSSDQTLYFGNTAVKLSPKADPAGPIWALVKEITSGYAHVRIGGKTQTIPIEEFKWDFSIPNTGLYDFKNSVILFERRPVRDTKKGLCPNNTTFHDIMSIFVDYKRIPRDFYLANAFLFHEDNLNLLFCKPREDFEKSLEKIIKKQALCRSVTGRIAISQGIMSKSPTIWLKNRLIGELDLKKEKIIPLHHSFSKELEIGFEKTPFQLG